MNWGRVNLGDVAEFKNGLNFNKDQYGQGVKYISVADFQDYFSVKTEGLAELKEDFINPSYFLKKGDILFVRSNGNKELVGRNLFIENTLEPLTFSGFCIRARFTKEDVLPKFYAYLFKSKFFRNTLSANAGGTNINNLNQSILSNLNIPKPPLPTQRKIASILSAYDDLIENNLKRIKLLEEKALLRYRGIVKEEKLDEKSILDVCYVTDGTHDSPKQQVDGYYLVTGKHLIGGFIDFSSAYFISEADHDKIQKRSKVVNGDLVLSNIGTIGNVAIIDSPFGFSVKNVIIFKPNDPIYTSFLYCYLNSNEMKTRFQQESSGTSQRFISLAYTRALKVNLPAESVLKEFHQEVSRLLKLKSLLNQQNTKLREARDILLPKLMNGQIEV
ncbi:restriction endonuclease subunit S [Agriterribacter humi]|uniref:restriction endonuclease subunit S n=1 Tax=Agriterribacter humi TaxID=1104781 RepID=UPI0012644B50|nr:restriction endonuclease subunit S [Agriterribacter humi]